MGWEFQIGYYLMFMELVNYIGLEQIIGLLVLGCICVSILIGCNMVNIC